MTRNQRKKRQEVQIPLPTEFRIYQSQNGTRKIQYFAKDTKRWRTFLWIGGFWDPDMKNYPDIYKATSNWVLDAIQAHYAFNKVLPHPCRWHEEDVKKEGQ